MKLRLSRLARRIAVELALGLYTLAAAAALAHRGLPGTALLALLLGAAACAAGILVVRRSGALAMAWLCPRLDALAVRSEGRLAPWEALVAAEAALGALDAAGRYREFFPDARKHLLQSALRAVAAHHLADRARAAIAEAPEGAAKQRLVEQEALARREVASLCAALRELKARFVASTAPVLTGQAPSALATLAAQSEQLGLAIDDLHRAPEGVPVSGGMH